MTGKRYPPRGLRVISVTDKLGNLRKEKTIITQWVRF